jgi:hypothetical protein
MAGIIDGLVLHEPPSSPDGAPAYVASLDVDRLVFLPTEVRRAPIPPDELVPPFFELTTHLAAAARRLSAIGAVLYLHLEFHGGSGFHEALGWAGGTVAFQHLITSTPGEGVGRVVHASGDMAINVGLRWLGVSRGTSRDEFAAVGLNRYRWNEDWIASVAEDS